jgi:outer membrane protein insertion porin family
MSLRILIAATWLGLSLSPAAEKPADSRLVVLHGLKVRVAGASDDVWKTMRGIVELQLSLVEDDSPSPPLADDLAFFIRKEYFKLGYPNADVTWDIAGDEIVLLATEGEPQTVGRITWSGSDAVTEEEVRDYVLSPTKERIGSLGKHPPLVEGEIDSGAGLVERLLESRGYLSASVSEPEYNYSPGKPTDIHLMVTEGPRSVFGDIFLNGELPAEAESVRVEALALKGQPFSEVRLEEIRGNLEARCQAEGHYRAKATASAKPNRNGGEVPVVLALVCGPVYFVNKVNVAEEFSRGAQRIINAGFRPAEGDAWDTADLELMQRRVMDSGVFSMMDVVPGNVFDDQARLDLMVTGAEARRRTLGIFGGYETLKGPILGVEWRHVNFADTGNTLRLRAGYEAGGFEGSIRWIDYAILNSTWTSDTELSAQTVSLYDYTHDSLKLRTSLSRQFTKRFALNVFGYVSSDSASSSALTPAELGPSSYEQMAFGGTISYDRRDSPVLPRKGWMSSLSVEAGAADINYLRTDVRLSYYLPITEHFRFAANWQAASIATSEGVESLPIDARIYNGGASTVRSFPERELGPISASGTPLGGTLMHAANLEFSYEVIDNLEIAVFADAGMLSTDDDTLWAVPEDLRYAVGLGVRYMLPVGPLRVDYGYNPEKRPGEPSGALHITFGFAF